jgi:putative peptide maturation system protein
VADAIARLDVLWQSERLMQAMVDGCLIEDALRSSAISVDGQEIQQALDSIRRRRGLYSAAQMRAWMQASGTSEQSLEHMAVEVARARKLRDHLVGGRAEIMLRERLCDFDLISFAQLPMPSAEAAHRALDNMRSGSANFHELAELECARGGHTASLYFRRLRRLRLELPLARALEGARPGVSVGPVELGSGVNLVKLVAVEPAQLGPQTLEAAKAKLFEEWLDERRGRAKVEWFWGNTERTSTRACVHGDLSPWADGT